MASKAGDRGFIVAVWDATRCYFGIVFRPMYGRMMWPWDAWWPSYTIYLASRGKLY